MRLFLALPAGPVAILLALFVGSSSAHSTARLRGEAEELRASANQRLSSPTFEGWYATHQVGRGIWKWSNALTAYTRHFSVYAGNPVAVAEVGVQSGGSIDMWHSVLGSSSVVHGIDINQQVRKFATPQTTITIGDQEDANMWGTFFQSRPTIDILIDDGGHEPKQMLVTLEQVMPRLNGGGFAVIEDIHGQHYVPSFFRRAATLIAVQASVGRVDTVHLYPYLLMVQAAGVPPMNARSELTFAGTPAPVASFEQMWASIKWIHENQPQGGHVVLENAGWGPFLTDQGLANFFSMFADLHHYQVTDSPPGCATTPAAVCVNTNHNSGLQASVTGVHIYPTRLVVEVAGGGVVISATRRGTEWLNY